MTNPISYASYNFEDAVVQLQNWLKAKGTWKDAYRSGTGQMMAEFYGALANLVLYYQERAAQELYLPTAKNKSSVINLVALLGYKPKRVISAYAVNPDSATPTNATVIFTIPTALGDSNSLTIGKYTKLATATGLPFLTTTSTTFTGSSVTKSVDIIQGKYQSLQYSSDGTDNQEYQLQYTNVENTSIEVQVNGITWTQVDSFLLGGPASQWYKVIPNLDDTVTVQFGDNVYAQAPTATDVIVVSFILSDGSAGNVYAANAINTIVTQPWIDALGNKVEVTVTNLDSVLGGADAEGIEEIRSEAPKVFQTGDRAVTKEDFKSILLNCPIVDIMSANAWGENEETPPNYTMFNRVKLCTVLAGWNVLSDSFKDDLGSYLYTKSMMTVKYTFVDPDIIDIIPTIDLKVIKGNVLETVRENVISLVNDEFVLGTTSTLGVPKRIGDVVAAIEGTVGVSYSHTSLLIYRELALVSGTNYSVIAPVLPMMSLGVALYATVGGVETHIAQDNGVGAFISAAGYTVTGTVAYDTGIVDVNVIVPALGVTDVVSLRYSQNASGDVVVGQNQIVRCNTVNITSATYE